MSNVYPVHTNMDIAPDGLPRLYMRKPCGDIHVYARPLTAEEIGERLQNTKQPSLMKTQLKTICIFFFLVFLKTLDTYLLRLVFVWLPGCLRVALVVTVVVYHRHMKKAIFYRAFTLKLPITAFSLRCIYYPVLILCSFNIFYRFDDLIEGPMFRDAWKQQLHTNIRNNIEVLIENPFLLPMFIPK